MKTIVRAGLMGLAAAATAVSLPRDASACGGAWIPVIEKPKIDHRVPGVDRYEKTLDTGEHIIAAAAVLRMMPHIRTMDARKSRLSRRAMRILALAVAREGGALPITSRDVPAYLHGSWTGKTEADRTANLDWAVSTLRSIDSVKKDDPAARTELAEALAQSLPGRAEARRILEDLAMKDLVSSARGYAVLAKLRTEYGDGAGGRTAMKRCVSMARSASICRVDGIASETARG